MQMKHSNPKEESNSNVIKLELLALTVIWSSLETESYKKAFCIATSCAIKNKIIMLMHFDLLPLDEFEIIFGCYIFFGFYETEIQFFMFSLSLVS